MKIRRYFCNREILEVLYGNIIWGGRFLSAAYRHIADDVTTCDDPNISQLLTGFVSVSKVMDWIQEVIEKS